MFLSALESLLPKYAGLGSSIFDFSSDKALVHLHWAALLPPGICLWEDLRRPLRRYCLRWVAELFQDHIFIKDFDSLLPKLLKGAKALECTVNILESNYYMKFRVVFLYSGGSGLV